MRTHFFRKGFSLVEAVVGITLFTIVATMIYQSYTSILSASSFAKLRSSALALANEQMEIVRTMPYASKKKKNGLPPGIIPRFQQFTRDNTTFNVTTTVRTIDDPFDGTVTTSPADLSPADYKLVEIEIGAPEHPELNNIFLTTYVAAKNLESNANNGSLFVRVFNANGQPLPQAFVTITNNTGTSTINILEVTDNNGYLQIVDAPTGTEAYNISVTKPGYSTDKTYAVTTSLPHPVKPPATVLWQQITQISFAIDSLGRINVFSLDPACNPIANVGLNLTGAKIIGTDPSTFKFTTTSQTDASGQKTFQELEWDDYTITLQSNAYDLIGTIPSALLNLAPGGLKEVKLVLGPLNPNTLLINIKDAATLLPISGATVSLTQSETVLSTGSTGRGFLHQTDWSGGAGQEIFSEINRYYQQSGTISGSDPVGEIKLAKSGENYASDGWLESSTFDTGAASNFHNILWNPTDQQPENGTDSVKFQIATATSSSSTFTYKGPDGTSATYYTATNNTINSLHNGDRYFRYKVFLSSVTPTTTPNVAEISFTFTTACMPPGQTHFQGLSNGTYIIQVEKSGYVSTSVTTSISSAWQQTEIKLMPE